MCVCAFILYLLLVITTACELIHNSALRYCCWSLHGALCANCKHPHTGNDDVNCSCVHVCTCSANGCICLWCCCCLWRPTLSGCLQTINSWMSTLAAHPPPVLTSWSYTFYRHNILKESFMIHFYRHLCLVYSFYSMIPARLSMTECRGFIVQPREKTQHVNYSLIL